MNQYNKEHLYKGDILLCHIIGTCCSFLRILKTLKILAHLLLISKAEDTEDTASHLLSSLLLVCRMKVCVSLCDACSGQNTTALSQLTMEDISWGNHDTYGLYVQGQTPLPPQKSRFGPENGKKWSTFVTVILDMTLEGLGEMFRGYSAET